MKSLTKAQIAATEPWMRNQNDEWAVDEGCWWDLERAAYHVFWVESNCALYEGVYAGEPLVLHSIAEQPDFEVPDEFYDSNGDAIPEVLEFYAERFRWHNELRESGEFMHFHLECAARFYGWQRPSKRWLKRGINQVRRFTTGAIWCAKKNSKALSLDTVLPTPEGWTSIGRVKSGDVLFDKNGNQCNVTHVHEEHIPDVSYRIRFSNGQEVVCNGEHLWDVESLLARRPMKSSGSFKKGDKFRTNRDGCYYSDVWSTSELYARQCTANGVTKAHRVVLHDGLKGLPKWELPIDPYWFGYWLGDGSSDRPEITCDESDEWMLLHQSEKTGIVPRRFKSNSNGAAQITFKKRKGAEQGLKKSLVELGVLHNKHIPVAYERSSFNQRLSLLQGLMDSDGTIGKSGKHIAFSNKSTTLVDGLCRLLSSLGIKYSRKRIVAKCQGGFEGLYWRVQFHCFKDTHPVFRLPRKLSRQRSVKDLRMRTARSRHVHIESITKEMPVKMRCITVDAPSGTFLFGETMLPTHNSPILAKDILYITCADGEDGMKAFICAKDGKQAMIPWQHAHFMIKQSDNLRDPSICTPNLTTKRVVYQPTNSWFEPLSSANSRVQDAKEGLNGSIFIDETHTVDREFMSIVEFAGASRVQPVHMMYSTAGKNPDSYGKEMWDYGESVVSGQVKDTRYFHQSYHAPQKLTVEEFDSDPEMYIRMANPSLGLTVDLDEILSGWERAKRKGKFDIIKFFLYRLNVWSNAADVWLAPGVWEGCGSHIFDEAELDERPCVIGLDLARKFDMAAAVFAWTNDLGGVDLRPIFWVNEERIQQMVTHCPKMLEWKEAGFIRVNEGNVTDFADVESDLREEIAKWNVVGMVYDSTYAEGLIQRLQGGVFGPDGTVVYEPLNMGEQSMSQGPKTQTGPTTDFENQLKKKEIRHESHPVLDWQFSHANVKENGAGDIMVQKENRKSFKTVDGCQAAIMARWGLLDFEGFQISVANFYELYPDGMEI